MEKAFLPVNEIAEYLRLKPLAVYRMVQRKKIPYRRAGRSVRFIKEEIEAWLRSGGL